MSKYTPIYSHTWEDRDFLKMGKDGKLIFFFLLSNSAINNSGIYEIPIITISQKTGIPSATVTQLLRNGSISGVEYDLENEIVFVKSRVKYSPGGNPVRVKKGIENEHLRFSKTFLWNNFIELYPQFKDIILTVTQPLPNGSLPLPLTLPLDSKDLTNNKPLKIEFEDDWKRYPKKGNKNRAMSCYLKTVTTLERREEFLKKMDAYLASVDDPRYYKNGDTFFSQWKDLEVGPEIKAVSDADEKLLHLKKLKQARNGGAL
jgi:hypothetical protein